MLGFGAEKDVDGFAPKSPLPTGAVVAAAGVVLLPNKPVPAGLDPNNPPPVVEV